MNTPAAQGHVLFVAQSPELMRAGGTWMELLEWVRAARQVFGAAELLTPSGPVSDSRARELVAGCHVQRTVAPRWRRAIPDPLVTALKDARLLSRRRNDSVMLPADVPEASVRFVVQHHTLFVRQGFELARSLDVPLVVLVEALQVWEAQQWGVRRPGWARAAERFGELDILRRADVVACVSGELRRLLIERGIMESRVIATPNRADAERFGSSIPAGRAYRRRLGISEGEVVVGWHGSFRSFHALDVLLDAFELASGSIDGLTLLLVGDGPERQGCERRAGDIAGGRVLLPGAATFNEIPAVVGAFDIGVIAARAGEAFHYSPLKFEEFQAAGRPVVAPDVGELVGLGPEDGVLPYPAGDVVALSKAIVALAEDSAAREAMGMEARARCLAGGGTAEHLRRIDSMLFS